MNKEGLEKVIKKEFEKLFSNYWKPHLDSDLPILPLKKHHRTQKDQYFIASKVTDINTVKDLLQNKLGVIVPHCLFLLINYLFLIYK